MNSTGAWKSRIKSTISTNSRINALLNEPKSFTTAVRQKHLLRPKDNRSAHDAQHHLHQQYHHKQSAMHQLAIADNIATTTTSVEPKDSEIVNGAINVEHIKRMLERTVHDQMDKENFFRTYNSPISAKFCQILSREILNRLKEMHLDG